MPLLSFRDVCSRPGIRWVGCVSVGVIASSRPLIFQVYTYHVLAFVRNQWFTNHAFHQLSLGLLCCVAGLTQAQCATAKVDHSL